MNKIMYGEGAGEGDEKKRENERKIRRKINANRVSECKSRFTMRTGIRSFVLWATTT